MKLTRTGLLAIGIALSAALKIRSFAYGPSDGGYRAMLAVGLLLLGCMAWTLRDQAKR